MNNTERNWSNSWHYQLALLGGLNNNDFDHENEINICDYSKRVFKGIMWAIPLCGVALFVLRVILDVGGWIIQMIYLGELFPPYSFYGTAGMAFLGLVVGFTTLWFAGVLLFHILDNFSLKNKRIPTPSFISSLYDSIKNKYCFYIKIK